MNCYEELINPRKSDLSDKIKWEFFQDATVSVQLYVCNTWTLIERFEKKKTNSIVPLKEHYVLFWRNSGHSA